MSHVFCSSFGRTAKFKYGRSPIGTERPILTPRINSTHLYSTHDDAPRANLDAAFLDDGEGSNAERCAGVPPRKHIDVIFPNRPFSMFVPPP